MPASPPLSPHFHQGSGALLINIGMGRQIDAIKSNKDRIKLWHDENKPTDWIAKQLRVSRETLKRFYPDYKGAQGRKMNAERRVIEYNKNPKLCLRCKTPIEYSKRWNIYCSSTCSTITNNINRSFLGYDLSYVTDDYRKSCSERVKDRWRNGVYDHLAHSPNRFNSKGERELLKYLQDSYPDDGWTSGGGVILSNGSYCQRDIFSKKLKVGVEYDGIWHFEDIKGQLTKKHTKDILYEEWCNSNGWRLIRIDEDTYQKDKEFWRAEVANIIYNTDKSKNIFTEENINLRNAL